MLSNEFSDKTTCGQLTKLHDIDVSVALLDAIEADRSLHLQQGRNLTHQYNPCEPLKGTTGRCDGLPIYPEMKIKGQTPPGTKVEPVPNPSDSQTPIHAVKPQVVPSPEKRGILVLSNSSEKPAQAHEAKNAIDKPSFEDAPRDGKEINPASKKEQRACGLALDSSGDNTSTAIGRLPAKLIEMLRPLAREMELQRAMEAAQF